MIMYIVISLDGKLVSVVCMLRKGMVISMKCKRCGAQYSTKELKCPYCGEPNSLGMNWKNTEENARNETESIRKRVRHSAPLYVINQIWNVVIVVAILLLVLFVLITAILYGIETLHDKYVQSTASVVEADALMEADDIEELAKYIEEHALYQKEGYEKYTERVMIYEWYRRLLEEMMYFQQNEDWNPGESPRSYRIKSAMYYGQYMLEAYSRKYGRKLDYPENQRYLEKLQQNTVAFLEGRFGLTQEDIIELVNMQLYEEEQQKFIKMICERRGWKYED